MTAWVRDFPGLRDATPEPASEDASFRRYFRVHGDQSLIIMDAPPPQEDCRPFVKIARILENIGMNSVKVLETDLERGFLLLSDLGSTTYLQALSETPERAASIYRDALDALLRLQAGGNSYQSELPDYSKARLYDELTIFPDWLCRQRLGLRFSAAENRQWQALRDELVENALAQPQTMVHRDYHSRNLMFIDAEGLGDNPGILDFQDAVFGPLTYDLVSLLKDCYVQWPAADIDKWISYYHERSPQASAMTNEEFRRRFDLMGVQRHLKAAGIFARLSHRDGKHGYLQDIPLTLSYIVDVAQQYPALEFIGSYIAENVLPKYVASQP